MEFNEILKYGIYVLAAYGTAVGLGFLEKYKNRQTRKIIIRDTLNYKKFLDRCKTIDGIVGEN